MKVAGPAGGAASSSRRHVQQSPSGSVECIAEGFLDRLLAARDWSRPEDPRVSAGVTSNPEQCRNELRQRRTGLMPPNLRVFGPEDHPDIVALATAATALLLREPSLVRVPMDASAPGRDSLPVRVVGAIHGQFGDLLRTILDLRARLAVSPAPAGEMPPGPSEAPQHPSAGVDSTFDVDPTDIRDEGLPPNTRYVFLGNYAERGRNGMECVLLVLCLKVLFPQHVYVLRGNHDCPGAEACFEEAKRRFDIPLWTTLTNVFRVLPVAALVGEKVLCVHGGISPELTDLAAFERIQRPCEVPSSGLLFDLMWGAPVSEDDGWVFGRRGYYSCDFGVKAFRETAAAIGVCMLIRSSHLVRTGFDFGYPRSREVVSVCSAPDHLKMGNVAAVALIDKCMRCSFMVLPKAEHADMPVSWRSAARNRC